MMRNRLLELLAELFGAFARGDVVKYLDVVLLVAMLEWQNGREQIEKRAVFALIDDFVRLKHCACAERSPHALVYLARLFAEHFLEREAKLLFPCSVDVQNFDILIGNENGLR